MLMRLCKNRFSQNKMLNVKMKTKILIFSRLTFNETRKKGAEKYAYVNENMKLRENKQ